MLLERATRAFVADPRYRNDSRYVELWIAYADLLPEPADVFKFMHANHIGEDVGLFYMAWAWVAESSSNFVLADKIYARGIARKAEPSARLSSRYSQFQRRMYRRSIDALDTDAKVGAGHAGAPEPKVDLALLTAAAGGSNKASSTMSRDENGRAHAPRAALGKITASAAARSHRPTAYAEDGAYREDADALQAAASIAPANRQGPPQEGGQRPPMLPPSSAAPPPPVSNTKIAIFEDAEIAAAPARATNDELGAQRPLQVREDRSSIPSSWTEFGTEAGRRKENAEAPSKWSEAGPLKDHAGVRPAASYAPPAWAHRGARASEVPSESGGRIQIFVDEPSAPQTVPSKAAAARATLPSEAPVAAPIKAAVDSSFEEARASIWMLKHAKDAAYIASCVPKIANGTMFSVYVETPPHREAARRAAAAADARLSNAAQPALNAAKPSKPRATGSSVSVGNRRQTFAAPTGELLRRYGYDAPAACALSVDEDVLRSGDSTAELPAGLRFSDELSLGRGEATARQSTLDELFVKNVRVAAAPPVPSPSGPSSFSPGALASSRGPRESMLNRLFEDVDGEENGAAQPVVGRHSLPLEASDVSSIAGDGSTIGGVAVTRTISYAAGGFSAPMRPVSNFEIFSDFTDSIPVSSVPVAKPSYAASVDSENAPKPVRAPATDSKTVPAKSVSLFKVGPRPVARDAPASASEDVTLHTRLAMDDLEGLFASPRRAPSVASAPRIAFAVTAASVENSKADLKPVVVSQPPPPPPRLHTASSPAAADAAGSTAAVPAKRTRALPPDARRLSMGFSLSSRRQSGIGGRASLSHAVPPVAAPSGGTYTIVEEECEPSAAEASSIARGQYPQDNIENSLGCVVPGVDGTRIVLGPSLSIPVESRTAQHERSAGAAASNYAGLVGIRHPHHAANQFTIAED